MNDSIAEKIGKMIPDIVSKVKEEIITESRVFSKNSSIQVSEVSEEKIEEPIQEKKKTVNIHKHIICDECQCNPIIGVRYKCAVCADFDLCEKCEAKTTHDHPFLKIKHVGQTPLKIITILDSEEESAELNGHRVPLNGLGQCFNMFNSMFAKKECPKENETCKTEKSTEGEKVESTEEPKAEESFDEESEEILIAEEKVE